MPLIESLNDTRLKSLRYSGLQPIVTKDINNPPVYNSLMRQAEARADDVTRLATLFSVGPGLKFAANQAALTAIDRGTSAKPKQRDRNNSTDTATFGQVVKAVTNLVVQTFAKSTVSAAVKSASTIAQAAAQGTGTHFVLGFAGGQGYLSRTRGHVLSSQGKFIPIPSDFQSELENAETTMLDIKSLFPDSSELLYGGNKFDAATYSYDSGRNTSRLIKDFTDSNHKAVSGEVKKDTKYGLGGNRKLKRYIDYKSKTNPGVGTKDEVNATFPTTDPKAATDDIIKFNFGILDPSKPNNPTYLHFRAYLDDFSDSYNGNWNSFKYLGRAEDFYTYGGFSRNISLSFKSAAGTREELAPIYTKLNMLASTTAPTYGGPSGQFMRGTLVNVNVGDYLVDQTGFITSVTYAWQTAYPWEIKADRSFAGADANMQQVPHILDCAVEFTPIHKFAPQTGKLHYFTNPNESRFFYASNLSEQETLAQIENDALDFDEQLDLEELEADIAEFDID